MGWDYVKTESQPFSWWAACGLPETLGTLTQDWAEMVKCQMLTGWGAESQAFWCQPREHSVLGLRWEASSALQAGAGKLGKPCSIHQRRTSEMLELRESWILSTTHPQWKPVECQIRFATLKWNASCHRSSSWASPHRFIWSLVSRRNERDLCLWAKAF